MADSISETLQETGLADESKQVQLDQATFIRTVEDGSVQSLKALLKHRRVDVNALNNEGISALHLAVLKYENYRNLDIAQTLLENGADVLLKAATPASAYTICIHRPDDKHAHGQTLFGTRKIEVSHTTPLLLALEIKSSLYVRGWEYRHWDQMLELLAAGTMKQIEGRVGHVGVPSTAVPVAVQHGWCAVFEHAMEKGAHDIVEVWVEGKHMCVLKLLLVSCSKMYKAHIDAARAAGHNRLEIKDASFSIMKALIQWLYSGEIEEHFFKQRGHDLFSVAHKHGVDAFKHHCEANLIVTPDNWIKILSVAIDAGSNGLIFNCAKSIHETMVSRVDVMSFLRKSFSQRMDDSEKPGQLFHKVDESAIEPK